MNITELKAAVCRAIDENAAQIIQTTQELEKTPELGYKETKTAAAVVKFLTGAGYTCREGLALTGIKTSLSPGAPGPNIAVIGELDAVVCPDSPAADPLTGAAHACGHNLQLGAMLGAALGLKLRESPMHWQGMSLSWPCQPKNMWKSPFASNCGSRGKSATSAANRNWFIGANSMTSIWQ